MTEDVQRIPLKHWSLIPTSNYTLMHLSRSVTGLLSGRNTLRRHLHLRIRCWLVNQHWICWQHLGDTQRQARGLISGPCLGAKARFLSFNRTKSRSVTGLLTGRNTVRRHLHLTGLSDSPLCSRCGAEDETSAHILCECVALVSLRRTYLGSFLPDDI
jgi:hypothetical protein